MIFNFDLAYESLQLAQTTCSNTTWDIAHIKNEIKKILLTSFYGLNKEEQLEKVKLRYQFCTDPAIAKLFGELIEHINTPETTKEIIQKTLDEILILITKFFPPQTAPITLQQFLNCLPNEKFIPAVKEIVTIENNHYVRAKFPFTAFYAEEQDKSIGSWYVVKPNSEKMKGSYGSIECVVAINPEEPLTDAIFAAHPLMKLKEQEIKKESQALHLYLIKAEVYVGRLLARESKFLTAIQNANGNTVIRTIEIFIPGVTLFNFLQKNNGKLSFKLALAFAIEAITALSFLAKNFVVHGDFKIENVIVTDTHELKLIDFGFAQKFNPDLQKKVTAITSKGPWLPPDKYIGPKYDIFSLGIMLYYIFGINISQFIKAINNHLQQDKTYIVPADLQLLPNAKVVTQILIIKYKISLAIAEVIGVIIENSVSLIPEERFPYEETLQRLSRAKNLIFSTEAQPIPPTTATTIGFFAPAAQVTALAPQTCHARSFAEFSKKDSSKEYENAEPNAKYPRLVVTKPSLPIRISLPHSEHKEQSVQPMDEDVRQGAAYS